MKGYPRFAWLVPGVVCSAPHPDLFGGLAALAPALRAEGVGAILTLGDEPLEPDPGELGFAYRFVATPNYRPPPDLAEIVTWLDAQIAAGRPPLVHCFAGIGRTGTVLVAWALHRDPELCADDAIAWVRERSIPTYAHSRFPEDPSQERAMRAFAEVRGGSSR